MRTLWLKIYLNEKPNIQLVRSERGSLFEDYEALTQFPGSIGHYDWLRSSSGQILGVRYWPFDDSIHSRAVQILKAKCQSLDYAFVDADPRYLSILFSKAKDIDDTISNDQDMGENGIYSAKGERIALCFEIDPPFERHFLIP
jgi:hypothetical protein